MKKSLLRKLRREGRGGFTLTELLVTLLIVAIVAGSVTAGISAALKTYRQSRFVSESATLSSTINTALSDVLRYASDVTGSDDTLRFVSGSGYGNDCGLSLSEEGYLQYDAAGGETPLLPQSAYTDLRMEDFTLHYLDGAGLFYGEYTLRATTDAAMEGSFTFAFRTASVAQSAAQ